MKAHKVFAILTTICFIITMLTGMIKKRPAIKALVPDETEE